MTLSKVSHMDSNIVYVSAETTSIRSTKQAVAEKIKYECDLCGAPFYHRLGLSTHKRRLHADKDTDANLIVVVKQPEASKSNKRKNKIPNKNNKSAKISGKNERNADVTQVLNRNQDCNVPIEICYKNKKEENVLLEICDVREEQPYNPSKVYDICNENSEDQCASPDSLGKTNLDIPGPISLGDVSSETYPLQFASGGTNTETQYIIPSTLCETSMQDDVSNETFEENKLTIEQYCNVLDSFGQISYECSECRKIYRHKRSLYRHIQEVHIQKNSDELSQYYTCNTCNVPFNTKNNTRAHLIRKHTSNKKLCLLCRESFKAPRFLSKHMLEKHTTLLSRESTMPLNPEEDEGMQPEEDWEIPIKKEEEYQEIQINNEGEHPEIQIKNEVEMELEEYGPTVFIPVECEILPVEFENTPKVPKMCKTNAEMCRDYRRRKKGAQAAEKQQCSSINKTIKKTGAERNRAYRLRKKMLAHVNQSSETKIFVDNFQ